MPLKYDIKYFADIAKTHEGECLALAYTGINTKVDWKCKEGHIFNTKFDFVKNGGWCTVCTQKQTGINHSRFYADNAINLFNRYKDLAIANNYKILDDFKPGKRVYYTLECPKGHIYNKQYRHTDKPEFSCKECYWESKRVSIDYYSNMFKEHGFTCNNIYKHPINGTHMGSFSCSQGHIFDVQVSNLRNSTKICNQCVPTKKHEFIVRGIFENIFNAKFPSCYPPFLKYKNNANLELDGFNEALKIAFEYDGPHHFKSTVYRGKPVDLDAQQERDIIKNRLCMDNGITLIRIPYTVKNKEDYIKKQLKDKGVIS